MAPRYDLSTLGLDEGDTPPPGFDQYYPTQPTVDSPYGTPNGLPDASSPSGSPYFPSADGTAPDQRMADYNPYSTFASTPQAPPTMTGGGFDWSQFPQVSASASGDLAGPVQQASSSGYDARFTAPTGVDMQNDPGYQFRIDQAAKAQQASAFGRLSGLTAGTQKAIGQTTQDAASAEYQNVFNRALAGFQANTQVGQFNASQGQQASEFNASLGEQHNQNQFGNLYSLANLGYGAANNANADLGAYGTNATNLATGYGGNLAGLYGTQGNINASAAAGQGNIWSTVPGALAGVGNAYLANRSPYGAGTLGQGAPANYVSNAVNGVQNSIYGNPRGVAVGDNTNGGRG